MVWTSSLNSGKILLDDYLEIKTGWEYPGEGEDGEDWILESLFSL